MPAMMKGATSSAVQESSLPRGSVRLVVVVVIVVIVVVVIVVVWAFPEQW